MKPERWIECNIQLDYSTSHLKPLALPLQKWLHHNRHLWRTWHYLFEPEGMRFRVRLWWWSKWYVQREISRVLQFLGYTFYFDKGKTLAKDLDYDVKGNYIGEVRHPDWKERQQILRWGSELNLQQRVDVPTAVHCLMNQNGTGRRNEQINYLWWGLCGRNDDLQRGLGETELRSLTLDILHAVENEDLSGKKFVLQDRVPCCELDTDGDDNCPIHSAPGVRR